jgi:solute carrier family 13 (sodium-dependent dicarboxylate transporter), member 2/3/5
METPNKKVESESSSDGPLQVIEFDKRGRVVIHLKWQTCAKVLVILLLTFGSYFLPLPGLTHGSRICLAIFVGAAGLWVTEAIPPFATAIMVIVLSIYLLGTPGGPLGLDRDSLDHSYRIFLNPIASPVLVLFFGGFIMARAAVKHRFDVRLARTFLKPFGTKPHMLLLGVILITATFSMFMSNTATAAMMIAVLTPLYAHFEGRDPFKKALVLAVPFAANVGGIGTIIGTPPNAVAASVLGEMGHPVSFISWMMVGVPLAAVTLLALWIILIKVFKPRQESFSVLFPENLKITWGLVIVVSTFVVTVGLWLTESLHGIPSGVVALLPVLVFTVFRVIDREDLKKIEWNVLILVAGGLTLGVAMRQSGLSGVFVHLITESGMTGLTILVALIVFSLVISNFMSNTSAANLMIPIVTAIGSLSPVVGAMGVAFACSLAMSLPISTPPNAIAFATDQVATRDMARYGSLVSIIGLVFLGVVLLVIHMVRGLA